MDDVFSLQNKKRNSDFCLGVLGIDMDHQKYDHVRNYVYSNFKEYTDKHNYDFYIMKEKLGKFPNNAFKESDCPMLFDIKLLKYLLNEGYEYVVILDFFDVLITNLNKKFEDLINKEDSIFFSANRWVWDIEVARKESAINAGFCIFQNSKFTRNFIKKVENYPIEWNDNIRREMNDQVLFSSVMNENPELLDNIAIGDPLQQSFWFMNKPFF